VTGSSVGTLFLFIAAQLAVHLGIAVALGWLLQLPMEAVLTASNANVGGPATAASMAAARGWREYVHPACITGSLGYVIGTPIACCVAYILRNHCFVVWFGRLLGYLVVSCSFDEGQMDILTFFHSVALLVFFYRVASLV
jgi:Protein of unknown function (DUF819)